MQTETTQTQVSVPGKRIWLTWEKQRRNRSMSKAVNAPLYELISDRSRLLRYLALSARTLAVIRREKPSLVFAQNPSIVLSLLVVLLRPVFGYRVIIDCHNSGLYPLEGRNNVLNAVARFIVRRADRVIVTNEHLADTCRRWGGTGLVVPDPLPQFPGLKGTGGDSGMGWSGGRPLRLLCICTWAEDEPVAEIVRAAAVFSPQVLSLEVTGKPRGPVAEAVSLPESVTLLGFLSDAEYVRRLSRADAVIVLTKRDHCLNCGAYEAVSRETPGILSNSAALREHFSQGFVFVDNTTQGIQVGIHRLIQGYACLSTQVAALKAELTRSNRDRLTALEKELP